MSSKHRRQSHRALTLATGQWGKERKKGKGRPDEVQTQKGATAKERIPKEKMIPKEKKPMGIPEEEMYRRKWKKRIGMLHRVDILRRQREKRAGNQ